MRYDILVEEIKKCQPKVIVEIGTWNGDNAIRMCEEARKYNQHIYYLGFDLFGTAPDYELPKDAPSRSIIIGKLSAYPWDFALVQGDTRETIAKNMPTLPVDFIYIDGGHSVETIQSDWDNCEKMMHDKTVVIFDDFYHNREDIGAKAVISRLDVLKYRMSFIGEIKTFTTPLGPIEVQMVKVERYA